MSASIAAATTTAASTAAAQNDTADAPVTRRPRFRLFGLVAALIAGLLAPLVISTGSASAAVYPTHRTAWEVSVSHSVFNQLNAERRANHLPALHWSIRLQRSSRIHNMAMARFNQMSHQLPGEADFGRRMDNAGYHWMYAGENIAWNSSVSRAGAVQVQVMMYNERPPADGHRQNILSRNFHNVGVDVFLDHKNHKLWLTTDFGQL